MSRRSGLGKGLGSLLPNAEQGTEGDGSLRELPIELIEPNQFQPRDHFDEDSLASLTDSIRAAGVLQPVLVRANGDHFELIAGERRWRAAKAAGLETIPALVRDVADTASLEQALIENLHREDLSALEEAAAYQQLADDFSLSYDEIGRRAGKSRSAVANAVRLLQLPTDVQALVNARELSAGHARALLPLPGADQAVFAARIVAEDLSVRDTEQAVRQWLDQRAEPEGVSPRPKRPIGDRPPGIVELEETLSEHLDTRVQITVGGKQRGKIVLSFAGYEDLERLCTVIQRGREASDPPVLPTL